MSLDSVLLRDEVGNERIGLFEAGHTENAEADYVALGVDSFHNGIMLRLFLITGSIGEPNLEKVGVCVEPNFYFIGHC
jgi:hypothetical protein